MFLDYYLVPHLFTLAMMYDLHRLVRNSLGLLNNSVPTHLSCWHGISSVKKVNCDVSPEREGERACVHDDDRTHCPTPRHGPFRYHWYTRQFMAKYIDFETPKLPATRSETLLPVMRRRRMGHYVSVAPPERLSTSSPPPSAEDPIPLLKRETVLDEELQMYPCVSSFVYPLTELRGTKYTV